ncbi:MAG: Acetyl xylan esterase (AXE1)/PhoPQ-activated pathogenicity-related protein [Planctomycetaceae bacterium]|nr:Acetyl xylan esterase (AXE1)/PhoPQ-activated pathogenicity-related protein [Planctomycetaceae bacterium]
MITYPKTRLAPAFLSVLCLLASATASAQDAQKPTSATGPWNLEQLKQTPKITWLDQTGPMRKLLYESEPRNGKPTQVFGYCAFPEKATGKSPAVVLIHGGGGKAFPEWAKLWADRGYVALAMDLAGKGADGKPLPDGGPDQSDEFKFPKARTDLKEMWSYHAVAACIRAGSVLASLPEVDPEKIGATGISWGGYLTCIVAGLDDRLKFAVPVYGCGFLDKNSAWLGRFAAMPADWHAEWSQAFDPSTYVGLAKMPVLFVNGTNDFAYPLDSYQATYQKVKQHQVCVTVNMPHGHTQGWAPIEIALFADQYVKGGKPLPVLKSKLVKSPTTVHFENSFEQADAPQVAAFHWTTDTGPWQMRKWQTKVIPIQNSAFNSEVPSQRPIVFFTTVKDARNATMSTEHVELKD